jgi:hypothetical protein
LEQKFALLKIIENSMKLNKTTHLNVTQQIFSVDSAKDFAKFDSF